MDGTYKKSKGNAGLEGMQFQLDLLTVFLLNAHLNHKGRKWRISSENRKAGRFDDIVFELPERSVLLASKFKHRKITRDQLFSFNSKNTEFSLPKYFLSYLEMKSEFRQKTVIICTNAGFNTKGLDNVLVPHNVERDNLLHCKGAPASFFTLNEAAIPDLKSNAEIYLIQSLHGRKVDKMAITDESITEFVKNFQCFSNYPSGHYLRKIIEQLLSLLDDPWCNTSYYEIYRKVEDWFKRAKAEYLTEAQVNAMLCEIRSDQYCESLTDFNVSFNSNDLDIPESKRIIHVEVLKSSKEGYLLQILKIYCSLKDHKSRQLYVNPNDTVEVQKLAVEAFNLPRYLFLIMVWEAIGDKTAKREIIKELRATLQCHKYKKVIWVANAGTDLAKEFGFQEIYQVDGSLTFQDFSKDSQERLLKIRNVLFQGDMTDLDNLLYTQGTEYCTELLKDSAILERLVRGKEIKVGARPLDLDENTTQFYVSRRFQSTINTTNVQNIITEENLYDVKEKIITISDSAGAGKSTALTRMAHVIKTTNPSLWVIKINLYDYTEVFRLFTKTHRNKINAVELLNSQEATKLTNDFEYLVFSMPQKVVLMLDGVDEISPDYTHLVLSLLSHCQEVPNFAKIFVTTRPHVDLKLKQVGLFRMLPFSKCEQIDFLANYWAYNLCLNREDIEKCKLYATTLIEKLSTSDNYRLNLFTEIPLQVKMVAEIFQENIRRDVRVDWESCREYLLTDGRDPKLPEKLSIAKLYDVFIVKKRDVFIEKSNPTESSIITVALLNQFEACIAYYQSLAVNTILPQYQQLFKTIVPIDNDMEMYVLKIGLVQRLTNRIHFIDRTFGEYFLANCIVRELEFQNKNAKFECVLIDIIFSKYEFKIVRTFLDIILQTVCLPPTIFKQYRSMIHEEGNLELIFQLAEEGHVAILRLILASINFKAIRGRSMDVMNWRLRLPFRKRNTLNDLAVLVRLAGINIKGNYGATPLHLAVKSGNLEMVDFLVSQGADIGMKDSRNWSALHYATHRNHFNIVKYLVEHGAEAYVRDEEGFTVLHIAAEFDKKDLVKYFLAIGIDIDTRDNKGRTALHLATYRKNGNIVNCLVEHGADVNAKDEKGCTALDFAVQHKLKDIVDYLMPRGSGSSNC